jgi:hypothetical protein
MFLYRAGDHHLLTGQKIDSLMDIVKLLFIKIVIQYPMFHDVPRFSGVSGSPGREVSRYRVTP